MKIQYVGNSDTAAQNYLNLRCCFIHLNKLSNAFHNLFKECKGYLTLGNCQSNNLDVQIVDTTKTIIQ